MDERARRDPLDTALLRLAHDAARRRLRTEVADAERGDRGSTDDDARRRGSAARVSRAVRRATRQTGDDGV